MESLIYFVAGYLCFGLVTPLAWIVRAKFLKRTVWAGMPVYLWKSVLPAGAGACAMWTYGFNCVILDSKWVADATPAEISHILRHECGHLVLGHARTNCILFACGLFFLLPWLRARQEYEADVFAAMCKDERVIHEA